MCAIIAHHDQVSSQHDGNSAVSKGPAPTTILHRRSVVDGLPPARPEAPNPCVGPFSGSIAGAHGPVGSVLYVLVHAGQFGVIDDEGFSPLVLPELAEARMRACGGRGWAFSAVVTHLQAGSTLLTITGSPSA
jgi:hypothetical protein